MTKQNAILMHLEEKGNITSWEAIDIMQVVMYN